MSSLNELESSLERVHLSFRGNPLAEVLLVPAGNWLHEPLLPMLSPEQIARQQRFQNPGRQREYVTSRWLLNQLETPGNSSISHCRQWLAVASAGPMALGIDVESRLPRHLEAVSERLRWGELEEADYLQAWTLWEAWRKLAGGSVLDEPDPVYQAVLAHCGELFDEPKAVSGVIWFSRKLPRGVLSLAIRPG